MRESGIYYKVTKMNDFQSPPSADKERSEKVDILRKKEDYVQEVRFFLVKVFSRSSIQACSPSHSSLHASLRLGRTTACVCNLQSGNSSSKANASTARANVLRAKPSMQCTSSPRPSGSGWRGICTRISRIRTRLWPIYTREGTNHVR